MQVLVRGQAELLFEAGSKAAEGVITAGDGYLLQGERLLQQGEEMSLGFKMQYQAL